MGSVVAFAPLAGKVALVTGGSRGIGAATSCLLAERGCDVAVNFVNDHAAAEETVEAVKSFGRRAVALHAHVGDVESRKDLWQAFDAAFPRLDFLIVNAATGIHRPALELSVSGLRKVFAVNFESLLFLAGEALARMPQKTGAGERGRIVALSSIGAERALKNYGSVGASKAALEAMARQLACELGPQGVNVNVVRCGLCDTGVLSYLADKKQIIAETLARTPNGRLVEPRDVAQLIAFILSAEAAMVNGQMFNVDGGYSATCS